MSAAVDGKSWLYKAAYCCPRDIALNEEPTPSFYAYLKKCIKMIYQQGIEKIVLVFDGCESVGKRNENCRRHEQRLYFLEEAKKSERSGDGQTAYKYYKRAVYISMNVVQKVLVKLAEWNVPFMIAPYEADAQLAYFGKYGFADVVITEDSDLLVYGCPKVFYKMDVNTGVGDFICFADLPCNQQLSFKNWDETQFMLFCCLMGCDYHPRVPKLGVKGIHAFIARLGSSAPKIDLDTALRRIFAAQGVLDVNEAVFSLKQALLTFKYHIVYNPLTKSTEHLTSIPPELIIDQPEEISSIVGEHIPLELVHDFIYGKIDPKEMQAYLLDNRNRYQPPLPDARTIVRTENVNEDTFEWQFISDEHKQDDANRLLHQQRHHVSRLQQQALELNQTAEYHLREAQHLGDHYVPEDKLSMNNPMPAKAFVSPSVAKKFQSMRRRRIEGGGGGYHAHGRHHDKHHVQHRAEPVEMEIIDRGEPLLQPRLNILNQTREDVLLPEQPGLYREALSKKRIIDQIFPEYQKTVSPAQKHGGGPVWR